MPTMKDVAKAAGVSIYTVSATLSGSAPVSAELRARVKQAVKALGYERNSVARGLRQGTSSLIGLIVSDVTNPFFTELVHVVEAAAHRAGYGIGDIVKFEIEENRDFVRTHKRRARRAMRRKKFQAEL